MALRDYECVGFDKMTMAIFSSSLRGSMNPLAEYIASLKWEPDGSKLLWIGVVVLVLLKLLLLSGTAVSMGYAPHDDGLYMTRAYHLLMDGGLGSYDSRLLVKQPGISLWLAGSRLLGIPYLLSINLFFAIAGIYFIAALSRLNVNRLVLFFVFALYLFNPTTIDWQWFCVRREPVAISLLVLILASMLFILGYLQERRLAIVHFVALAMSFSFALMVREEDRLLYALLLMFVVVVAWKYGPVFRGQTKFKRLGVLLLIAFPFTLAFAADNAMRSYVERHYGLPLLHDFGEGEYPRMIAAIRSVESRKDNRHVMITQEALAKIRVAVPMFAPVADRLPAPSETSYSCGRFKVCSEWTNGWELFWVKDAAFQAGLTPSLIAGQAYFRNVRLGIEQACQEGKLHCRNKGQGLLPPFELRWTRALLQEMAGVFWMMTMPKLGVVAAPPSTYGVDVEFGRMFQLVTMSHHFDSLLQSKPSEGWKDQPQDMYLALKYWLRYPDIATNQAFGAKAGGDPLGAQVHYERHGQYEGRIWVESTAPLAEFVSPFDSAKIKLLKLYEKFSWILEILGCAAFLLRLAFWRESPLSPLMWLALIVTLFTGLRLLAMSYVSVYMGGLDVRLFFSTYVVDMLLAPLIIADLLVVLMARRSRFRSLGSIVERTPHA